ncbi:3D domain-containing protein [Candidatus Uhrbacteria bacterium]|nr:3D domain-containing protein [Candidatus Uhrbacteria bacterium]
MTNLTWIKYNVLKKTCLAIMAVVLVGVQASTPVAMAANLVPALFWNETKVADVNDNTFVIPEKPRPVAIKTIRMASTAYTSRPGETDGSPFITADGSVVRDGYVATNVLPIGTKIRIPTVFGDKIFEVHDRMNPRYGYRVDIWMPDLKAAKAYGLKRNIQVEVIEMGTGVKNWEQWKGRTADLNKVGKYGPAAPPIEQPYLIAKIDDQS